MSAIAPALISAGASLLGGLFGKKERPKAQGVDYQKLRRDAEAAGFNPLTALLAGGGAGYQREFNPAMSSGAFIAEAIGRGVDTYFDETHRAEDQEAQIRREEEDKRRWEAEQKQFAARSFGYSLRDVQPFGIPVTRRGPKLSTAAKPLDPSPSDDLVNPSRKALTTPAGAFQPSGQWSDQEAVESRYGGLVGEAVGVASALYDVGANARLRYERSKGNKPHRVNGQYYMQAPSAPPKIGNKGPYSDAYLARQRRRYQGVYP